MDFDAKALRDHVVMLLDNLGMSVSCKVDVAVAGKYEPQRGSFVIHAPEAVLGIVVWEKGFVEIQLASHSGVLMEAVTLEKVAIEIAASKVVDITRQHT